MKQLNRSRTFSVNWSNQFHWDRTVDKHIRGIDHWFLPSSKHARHQEQCNPREKTTKNERFWITIISSATPLVIELNDGRWICGRCANGWFGCWWSAFPTTFSMLLAMLNNQILIYIFYSSSIIKMWIGCNINRMTFFDSFPQDSVSFSHSFKNSSFETVK